MDDGPTYASRTSAPCECGYLQRTADDPRVPIEFDKSTSEFQFVYQEPGLTGNSMLVIYYCPFCGGAAPLSKRHLLFAVITPDEEQRLFELLNKIHSVRDAYAMLGSPTRDDRSASTRFYEENGQPPRIEAHRFLVYEQLSDTADVWLTERADGTLFHQLVGKFLHSTP